MIRPAGLSGLALRPDHSESRGGSRAHHATPPAVPPPAIIELDSSSGDDDDDPGAGGRHVSDVVAATMAAKSARARRDAAQARKVAREERKATEAGGGTATRPLPPPRHPSMTLPPPPRVVPVCSLRHGRNVVALAGHGAACLISDAVAALFRSGTSVLSASSALEIVVLDELHAPSVYSVSAADLADTFGADNVLSCDIGALKALLEAPETSLVAPRAGAALREAPRYAGLRAELHGRGAPARVAWATVAGRDASVVTVPAFLELLDVIEEVEPDAPSAAAVELLRQRSVSITPPPDDDGEYDEDDRGASADAQWHPRRAGAAEQYVDGKGRRGHAAASYGSATVAAPRRAAAARTVAYRFTLHAFDTAGATLLYVRRGGESDVQLRSALSTARSSLAQRAESRINAVVAVATMNSLRPAPQAAAASHAAEGPGKRKRKAAATEVLGGQASAKPRRKTKAHVAAAAAPATAAEQDRDSSVLVTQAVASAVPPTALDAAGPDVHSKKPPGAGGSRVSSTAFRPAVPDADGWLGRG